MIIQNRLVVVVEKTTKLLIRRALFIRVLLKEVSNNALSRYPFQGLQNFRILRQIRDSILSPQMSNLMSDGRTKHQIFAEKRIFSH